MTAFPSRGRPRRFDTDKALHQVMAVFWQHGFGAATYEALEAATGLRRQSLIYAFGDKRTMFLKALDHYAVTRVAAICDVLADEADAKTSVRSAFDLWIADARRRKHRGCLMVTTAGEMGPLDASASAKIASARKRLVAAFGAAFERAAEEGSLKGNDEPGRLAELVVSAGDGALLHARNETSARAAETTLAALFQLIFK